MPALPAYFREIGTYKLLLSILVPSVLGVLVFLYKFDASILDPTNVDWLMIGDLGQHFTGWHAFRFGDWHFPITKTDLIGWPVGIPIVFTDSNPLIAIPLKLVSSILPENFQYIGAWYAFCLILQSLFAYHLGMRVSNNRTFSIAASLIFLFYPPLLNRWGHDTLMGHWLILWSISLYFAPEPSARAWRIHLQSFLILALSVGIHFYFTAMILPLVLGAIVFGSDGVAKSHLKAKIITVLLAILLLAGEMALLGYFSLGSASSHGFGYYSMNLNALFNPAGTSYFLPTLPRGPGQYEGYQYLGIGGLTLLATAGVILTYDRFSGERRLFPLSNRARFLTLYATATTLFAVSLPVMFGDRILMSFTLPEHINSLMGAFRSSGRFFWPVAYLLYVASLIVIWRRARPIAIPFVFAVCVIQIIDLMPLRAAADTSVGRQNNDDELASALKPWIRDADAIYAEGPWEKKKPAMYQSVLLAAPQGVPVIPVYSARNHRQLGVWENAFEENLARATESTRNILGIFPSGWDVCAPARSFLVLNNWVLMLPERSVESRIDIYGQNLLEPRAVIDPEQLVNHCGLGCALLIAAKDEASAALPERLVNVLGQRGSRIDQMGFRESYLVVIENAVVRHEDFGQRALHHHTKVFGKDIAMESAGNGVGNRASIRVDGIEFSHQRRGLNIVMLEPEKPVRSFSFDTHGGVCQ